MRVLITGTTGGIGVAIREMFAGMNAEIIELNRADADFSSMREIGALASGSALDKEYDWVVFSHGYVDAEKKFLNQKPEEVEKTFAVNTLSVIRLTQLFLPKLKSGGGVIYISSVAALTANGFTPAYSASKAAVNTFAQSLAHNRLDLKFFSICPGPTKTAMFQKLQGDMARAQPPEAVVHVVQEIISGSFASGDIIVVRDSQTKVAAHLPA